MLDDFHLIQHKFSSTISLIPIADVHLGAIEHNKEAWEAFLRIVDKDTSIRVGLVGDLVNNSVRNSVANPFDEILRPREQKKLMVEYLSPIKDRIIFSVCGNHESRTIKEADQDIAYDIMAKLDLEDIYRENIAFVKLGCGERQDSTHASGTRNASTYTIVAAHGAGGGIYTGSSVNRGERFGNVIENMDVLITAHTHKGYVSRPSKIVIDTANNIVTQKSYIVVSAESWLNYGGYASRKMLLPSESANPQKVIFSDSAHRKNIEVRW